MKAIISNRIYMLVTPAQFREIDAKLTYIIPGAIPGVETIIKTAKIINNNSAEGKFQISIPSGREDLIPKGYEIVDKRVEVPVTLTLQDSILPRGSQEKYLDFCRGIGFKGHILNAKPGWGKTIGSLLLVNELQQKTLIVTHTVALRNQWEREVEKVFGFRPGIIGSGKFNIEPPIVVANTQSLHKYINEVKSLFGVVLLDEMHHVASPSFSTCIDTLFCKIKIGLSATLKRKDGKDVVFNDYFGYEKFTPEKEHTMDPIVEVYSIPATIPEASHWAHRVTALGQSKNYRATITAIADKYVKQGHTVLIVFDKPEVLELLKQESKNRAECFHGGIKSEKDRKAILTRLANGEIDELYAGIKLFTEGVSEDILSALVLAQPINNDINLDQLLGRINRERPGKLTPKVADIKFSGYTGYNQFNTRINFYRMEGLQVRFM